MTPTVTPASTTGVRAPDLGLDASLVEDVRTQLLQDGAPLSDVEIARAVQKTGRVLGAVGAVRAVQQVKAHLSGLGPLEPLLPTSGLSDVYVNGHHTVYLETLTGIEKVASPFRSEDELRALAVRLITAAGRRLDDAHPCVDVQTPTGMRVHAVIPPVSTSGTLLSIRFRAVQHMSVEQLVETGGLHPEVADVLCQAMANGANLMISGATGSGKTTMLSALLSHIDPQERIVLIEDAAELAPVHPHVVGMQARHENVEGAGAIDLTELVRQALRMRPDRLVVGECRGAEVRELFTALNTGHAGAGTVHANSAQAVPARLAALGSLAGMTRETVDLQAASALDLVVHVARGARGRWVESVCVLGLEQGVLQARTALSVDAQGVLTYGPARSQLQAIVGGRS